MEHQTQDGRAFLVAATDPHGDRVVFASSSVDRAEAEHARLAESYPHVVKSWESAKGAMAHEILPSERDDTLDFKLRGMDRQGNAWYLQTSSLGRLLVYYQGLTASCEEVHGNRLFKAARPFLDDSVQQQQ